MSIKAIETRYRGARFRSRLEARWAVFFDQLGIPWEYEPEGYETPDGWYLPDFLLHLEGEKVWFEVKPQEEHLTADLRWRHVGLETERRLFVACGLPDPEDPVGTMGTRPADGYVNIFAPTWDNLYAFCICPACGRIGIEFEGRVGRICHHPGKDWDDNQQPDVPRIARAYVAAKSARFEHGESGAPQ